MNYSYYYRLSLKIALLSIVCIFMYTSTSITHYLKVFNVSALALYKVFIRFSPIFWLDQPPDEIKGQSVNPYAQRPATRR